MGSSAPTPSRASWRKWGCTCARRVESCAAPPRGRARVRLDALRRRVDLCYLQFLHADMNSAGSGASPPGTRTAIRLGILGSWAAAASCSATRWRTSRRVSTTGTDQPACEKRVLKLALTDGAEPGGGVRVPPDRRAGGGHAGGDQAGAHPRPRRRKRRTAPRARTSPCSAAASRTWRRRAAGSWTAGRCRTGRRPEAARETGASCASPPGDATRRGIVRRGDRDDGRIATDESPADSRRSRRSREAVLAGDGSASRSARLAGGGPDGRERGAERGAGRRGPEEAPPGA